MRHRPRRATVGKRHRRCAMRSLVVYESWFGNTRRIAEEIAAGLAHEGQVDLVTVDDPLPPLEDVDLLIVGAPTHIHGLSSKRSREGRSPKERTASREL